MRGKVSRTQSMGWVWVFASNQGFAYLVFLIRRLTVMNESKYQQERRGNGSQSFE